MKSPYMSPLWEPVWEKATAQEKAAIIEGLKPKPAFKIGESFQVIENGAFVKLTPGDTVPPVVIIIPPGPPGPPSPPGPPGP